MELAGSFFLCMPASRCRTHDNREGVLFALRQPSPADMFPDGLQAAWIGDDACAFLAAHESELRPGRGLKVSLNHLTARREGEVRARVVACELLPLPPSWIKHANNNAQAQHA